VLLSAEGILPDKKMRKIIDLNVSQILKTQHINPLNKENPL
jgi:hypothetical protein